MIAALLLLYIDHQFLIIVIPTLTCRSQELFLRAAQLKRIREMQMAVRNARAVQRVPDFSAVLAEIRKEKRYRTEKTEKRAHNGRLLIECNRFIDATTGTRSTFLTDAFAAKRALFRKVAEAAGEELTSESHLFNMIGKMGSKVRNLETIDDNALARLERFYEQLAARSTDLPYC